MGVAVLSAAPCFLRRRNMLQKKNYGADILHNIRRLSEVNEQRDIKPLMATSFPGTHCPLMGVLMNVPTIPSFWRI